MVNVIIAENKKEILDHMFIRGEVFMIEQAIDWDEEFDGADYDATLFVLYKDHSPIGAARLKGNSVGRVAVLKSERKNKGGARLMDAVEKEAKRQGIKTLKLGATRYPIL